MKLKHDLPNELELGRAYEFKLEEVGGEVKIPPDGTLLREKTGYKVWWMKKGLRRWITVQTIFDKMAQDLGFTGKDILIIEPSWDYDPTMLNDIPEGKHIIEWPENQPEPEPEDIAKILFAYTGDLVPLVKKLGFTVYQDYGKSIATGLRHLNAAQASGMRYMPTLPDKASETEIKERINAYKNHSAYYGILSFDDADYRCALGHWTPDDMRRVYDTIKKYDEKHPVWCTVCHGASREDDSWQKYLAIEGFDAFGSEIYVFKKNIPDPWEWLKYMYDRLNDYPLLQDKIVIPIIPTFKRGVFTDPMGNITRMYEYSKERLGGKKSCACYDWQDLRDYRRYDPEVKQINADL